MIPHMSFRRAAVLAYVGALCVSPPLAAYNQDAHVEMTTYAYQASAIVTTDLWLRLGLSDTPSTHQFPGSLRFSKTALELMRDGANAEDDGGRPVNHFFNPVDGSALSICTPVCWPAPDWALKDRAAIPLQFYSYRDARQHYYEALTLSTAGGRDTAFGLVFEDLGHVLHLIQDTAQPQHVRNDSHFVVTNPSLFENYTTPAKIDAFAGAYPLAYQDGDSRSLSAPRAFWQTGPVGAAGVQVGKGIAEFTNRNFVSEGTNFTGSATNIVSNPNFAMPSGSQAVLESWTLPGGEVLDFIDAPVTDTLFSELGVPTATTRISTFSLYDSDLAKSGKSPRFSVNSYNFNDALALLIPRAIAYSAGMIDYFFRGNIDLAPDTLHMGQYVIKNFSSEDMNGLFELYYDAVDGTRRVVPGAQWKLSIPAKDPSTGNPGLSTPFLIEPPNDAAQDGVYMLVFSGSLGGESKDTFSYGAVAGRKVSAALLEALYVAGLDAQGQVITLRVDEGGTHLLSGPDANGVVKRPNGFDPVRPIAATGQSLKVRPYVLKQATFPDGPGGRRYRMQAFEALAMSGIRDPITLQYNTGACCWQAQSPDPSIGTFVFNPGVGGPNLAALSYTRTYTDSNSQKQTTIGSVPLPPLPGYTSASYVGPVVGEAAGASGDFSYWIDQPLVDYRDLIAFSKIALSPDGLTISGFKTATQTVSPPLPWTPTTAWPRMVSTVLSVITLQISLSAVPSVAARVDTTYTFVDSSNWTSTIDYNLRPTFYCGLASWQESNNGTGWTSTRAQNYKDQIFVGSFDGNIQSYIVDYQYSQSGEHNDTHDTTHVISPPCEVDQYVQNVDHTETSFSVKSTYALVDGTLGVDWTNQEIKDVLYDPNPLRLNRLSCNPDLGGCIVMTGTGQTLITQLADNLTEQATFRIPQIVFAPYTNGTVYTVPQTTGLKSVMFRGMDLTGKDYVADASPLGEIFFALSDTSLIIHEPRNGRMPTFVRPPNMVKIVAALWL